MRHRISEIMAGYPLKERAFYNRIFWLALLNIEAYNRGYFDVLLSDTDDVYTFARFIEKIPDIKLWLDLDNDIGDAEWILT